MTLAAAVEVLSGRRVDAARALSGGSVGAVYRLDMEDGGRLVAKLGPGLEPEGFMLRWLADRTGLPLPRLLYADNGLILMDFVKTGGPLAQADAADHLARLHALSADRFGFESSTAIGGLDQPNPWTARWVEFFRDHRLLFKADQAVAAGRLPASVRHRIDKLAARLEGWFDAAPKPSLIHGDCWAGNVLSCDGRVAAFIDPAIHYADAEIELAFGTLFSTFDDRFFARYAEHRPLRPGFWEVRRDVLNLYPLLVHVRLFGGSYVSQVESVLRRFG